MASGQTASRGTLAISEMKEFAAFPARTQRYIRRSLAIAAEGSAAVGRWSRDSLEDVNIRVQLKVYDRLGEIRERVPEARGLDAVEPFMAPLLAVSAFDISQERIESFSAYRFLYERLIGAPARPWLPGAFCAAASLPHIDPKRRRDLLQSISESAATASGWSTREPSFFPNWVDKDDDVPKLLN